jgi:sec-independent protein translocase protein TatA
VELAPWHWIVVAIVAGILFFGWKNLPDMARSAGKSLRIFRTEIKGLADPEATAATKSAVSAMTEHAATPAVVVPVVPAVPVAPAVPATPAVPVAPESVASTAADQVPAATPPSVTGNPTG